MNGIDTVAHVTSVERKQWQRLFRAWDKFRQQWQKFLRTVGYSYATVPELQVTEFCNIERICLYLRICVRDFTS